MSDLAKRCGLLTAAVLLVAGLLGCKTNQALDAQGSETDNTQTTPQENGPPNDNGGNDRPGDNDEPANSAPAVDAGPDQIAREGMRVVLEATVDDADGDPLSVAWEQVAGAQASLLEVDSPAIEFEAPAVDSLDQAVLVFRVSVGDGRGGEASDTVAVRVFLGGDANMDDVVDLLDRRLVEDLFVAGGVPGPDGEGDLNLDGRVDARDLNMVLEDLGRAL